MAPGGSASANWSRRPSREVTTNTLITNNYFPMNLRYHTLVLFFAVAFASACHPVGEIDKPVKEDETQPIMFGGLRFEVDTLFMKAGEKVTPQLIISPAEISSQVKVRWMSSDESVVQVDDAGVVTAVHYGAAHVMAYVNESSINPKKYYRSIPVYVSFDDPPLSNPEEMYRKWLGRWGLVGPAYISNKNNPEAADYYASYLVSIVEKEPGESYYVIGWEKFYGSWVYHSDGSPVPGHPLTMTARFDKETGRLLFLRSEYEHIFLTSYWNRTIPYFNYGIPYVSYSGSYGNYGFSDDEAIGYVEFEEGKDMLNVRGFYGWKGGKLYRQIGMGFANDKGSALSDPIYFPIQMSRLSNVPISELILSKTSLVMEIGKERDLTFTWEPALASVFSSPEWSSSDPTVVTVKDGHLTALSVGQATVSITMGEVSASCEVTVKKPYIHFANRDLRDLICEYWDEDGDGEICFEEAAASTHLNLRKPPGSIYIIASVFDELQYFTSVTELPDYFLYLDFITIPANIVKIGDCALTGSSFRVIFLGPPPAIGCEAFGYVSETFSSATLWVADEYYDDYIREAEVPESNWSKYRHRIFKLSEKPTDPEYILEEYDP